MVIINFTVNKYPSSVDEICLSVVKNQISVEITKKTASQMVKQFLIFIGKINYFVSFAVGRATVPGSFHSPSFSALFLMAWALFSLSG